MSIESDEPDRTGDIDTIKQLLRKLEEAAVRESETDDLGFALSTQTEQAAVPLAMAASKPDVDSAALAVAAPLSEVDLAHGATTSQSTFLAPSPQDELATLQRGETRAFSSADDVLALPPTAIMVPDRTTAPTVVARASGGGNRITIAVASFALGIAAAGAVVIGFDRLRLKESAVLASATAPITTTAASAKAAASIDPKAIAPVDAAPSIEAKPAITAPEPTSDSAEIGKDEQATPTPAAEPPATKVADAKAAPSPIAAESPAPVAASRTSIESHPASAIPAAAPATTMVEIAEPAPVAKSSERKLHVADQVELRAGQRLQLSLGIAPAATETERLLVVFRDVPAWLSMSKGATIGNSIWLLPAHQANNVWLESSDTAATGTAALIVQLARIDGGILAERKVQVRVRAHAPLGSQTIVASSPLEQAVILQLQARGELLLDTGEVEAARTLLRTAAEAGSVAAALRLAETYDPGEVQRLGVTPVSADPIEAVRWYERAEALGSSVAASRLLSLGRR